MTPERIMGPLIFLLVIVGVILAYRFKLLDPMGPTRKLIYTLLASGLMCVLFLDGLLFELPRESYWSFSVVAVIMVFGENGIRNAWLKWRKQKADLPQT